MVLPIQFKSAAVCVFSLFCAAAFAADPDSGDSLYIGARREALVAERAPASTIRFTKKEWFKPGISDSDFFDEAFMAAKMLSYEKLEAGDRELIQAAILREKVRSTKAYLWLIDWNKCGDGNARLGAVMGLQITSPDSKELGKPLATSATFDPDERVRKASAALIKARKDVVAERALLDTWKSSYDDSGILDVNESRRKAAISAIRNVGEKQIFQALMYYAILEIRAGSAAPAGVDTVNIKGQQINLPIDLPKLELINVEGNIAVPAMLSLKQATGQDFGHNMAKWNDWISKLP